MATKQNGQHKKGIEPLEWRTEKAKVSDLMPWEGNPRQMTGKQASDLTKSIKKFNLMSIPVVDVDRKIVSGHQRCRILDALGRGNEIIDVRVPNRKLTDEEYREANIRENKNLGEWDFNLLANFEPDLLKEAGFDSNELDRIFDTDNAEDDFDADAAAEAIETPITQPGDVILIGRHKLYCGDATKSESYRAIMGDDAADLAFTDPPYNIDYSGRGKKTSNKIKNDNLSEDAFRSMLQGAFKCINSHTSKSAPAYICYASRTHREFEDAVNAAGYTVRNQIVWVKAVASMGWGDYRWKHEPILYCFKSGESIPFYGDRSEYTEWTEVIDDMDLLKRVKKMIEKEEKGGSTVWRLKRDQNYDHPTQKPVQLYKTGIQNSSKRGDTVLDPFAGGGTVAIACEQTERSARMIELDPRYCDVIVQRWEKFTGDCAIRVERPAA